MVYTKGTDCGFVTSRPSNSPAWSYNNVFYQRAGVEYDTTPSGVNNITEIGFYNNYSSSSGDWDIIVGLYDSSGDLLYSKSDTLSISGIGWYYTSVDWDVSASTDYGIVVLADTGTGTYMKIGKDNTSSGTNCSGPANAVSSLPDPWVLSSSSNNWPFYAIVVNNSSNPQIKLSGTFGQKPIKVKSSGSFTEKTFKVKVGGVFQ